MKHCHLKKTNMMALKNEHFAKTLHPNKAKLQTHNCKLQFVGFQENLIQKVNTDKNLQKWHDPSSTTRLKSVSCSTGMQHINNNANKQEYFMWQSIVYCLNHCMHW